MYIHIRVVAGAKKEFFEKKSETHFFCSVRQEARGNAANMRVREFVSDQFGIPVSKVRIISGHHSPSKIFDVGVET